MCRPEDRAFLGAGAPSVRAEGLLAIHPLLELAAMEGRAPALAQGRGNWTVRSAVWRMQPADAAGPQQARRLQAQCMHRVSAVQLWAASATRARARQADLCPPADGPASQLRVSHPGLRPPCQLE